MHSGMRGGPHVGAFRRCSFTETELKLQCESTSISRRPAAGLARTHSSKGDPFSVHSAMAARVLAGPPPTNFIPSQMGSQDPRATKEAWIAISEKKAHGRPTGVLEPFICVHLRHL